MVNKRIITILTLITLISAAVFAQDQKHLEKLQKEQPNNFYEVKKEMDAYFESFPAGEKKSGYKQYKRWEHFMKSRLMPDGSFPNGIMLLDAYQNTIAKEAKTPTLQAHQWKLIGPSVVPEPRENAQSTGIGRINAVELHPTKAGELWIAAAAGGVWRSTTDGASWEQKFPTSEFYTLGANDISISASNPNIIYVATGDSYGAGNVGGYQTFSIGVIKTTNGGNTWNTTGLTKTINEGFKTTRILCHKNDPNKVLVATGAGIYKTTDGGVSWSQTSAGTRNFYDMEVKPNDPNVVYASCIYNNSIYKTTDFGETWTTPQSISGGLRVELAVCETDPDVVGAVSSSNDNGFNSFWISFDAGETWDKKSDRNTTGNILGWDINGEPENKNTQGQGWYDLALEINPTDYAHIIVGGINMWESKDGGSNFKAITHFRGYYSKAYVHADFHDLNFASDGTLYTTNDGGIYKTKNLRTFTDISDGMPITQYYWFGSSNQDPTWLVCGAQDNGTVGKKGNDWQMVAEGDGVACMIDPNNKDYWYCSYVNGVLYRSINAGEDVQTMLVAETAEGSESDWVTPMCLDPLSTNRVFAGLNNVWRNESYGKEGSWRKISNFGNNRYNNLVNLRVYGDIIYTSTDNSIYASYDKGYNWDKIYSTNLNISDITIDESNPERFWFTTSGFSAGEKVFEYKDGAVRNISGNLENIPTHCIVWQPDSPDRLYVGTDIGVFYSDYNTGFWKRYGTDLPNTIVSRLEILPDHDLLRIATYGKGLWETSLMHCNLAPPVIEAQGETRFCEGGSVVLRAQEDYPNMHWSTGETTREITVSEAGFYSLEIIDGECSANSIPIEVELITVPELTISGATESAFCEGQNTEVTLRASFGFSDYLWSNNSTEKEITVTEPGTYSVHGITSDGCEADAEFEVLSKPAPDAPVINQQSLILVCTQPDAVAWQWYTLKEDNTWKKLIGKTDRKLDIDEGDFGTTFCVEIADAYGCVAAAEECFLVTSRVNDLNDDEYVKILPNPVTEFANLEMNITVRGAVVITLFDLNGRVVYETAEVSTGGFIGTRIDMSGLSTGTYLLNIKSGNRSYSDTIIKQ